MTGCELLTCWPELDVLQIFGVHLVASLEPGSIQLELLAERVFAHDLGGEVAVTTLLRPLQSLVRQEPATIHLKAAVVGWNVGRCLLISTLFARLLRG